MLFKVFTVLSVIFLQGGLADHQSSTLCQNDALRQMLHTLTSGQMDADKKDDNQLNKALVVLIETLSKKIASKSQAPDQGNTLIAHLKELLSPSHREPTQSIKEQERAVFVRVLDYLGPEMKHLSELIIKYTMGQNNFHAIMMDIIDKLENERKSKVVEMYRNYLMQTSNYGYDVHGKKDNETKEPMACMTGKESCMKMEHELETSPLVKIMKLEGWRRMFGNEYDHNRFTEMVKYIEESNSSMAWLNHLFMAAEKNEWIWKIGHQMLSTLEKNTEMRDKLMYFVQDHKDLLEIMVKASHWVKSKNFNMSSPTVQRIVHVLSKMGFADHEESMGKHWLDSYMDWVDCNFGKHEEMTSLMKTIGVMLKNDHPVKQFLHMLDFTPADMINVTLQLKFNNVIRCNNTVEVLQQKLIDVLYIKTGADQFCSTKTFTVVQRMSTVTSEMGPYIQTFGITSNTPTNIWKIDILKGSNLIESDANLNYIPMNGHTIYFYYGSR